MLEILKVQAGDPLAETLKAGEMCYAARDNGELLGKCIYRLVEDAVEILELWMRDDDPVLADGIVRAAVSSVRMIATRVRVIGESAELVRFVSGVPALEEGECPVPALFICC